FIDFLRQRSATQKIFVFVDEAQKVHSAARFFKGVYDSKLANVKLILTGSSSLEIKTDFKETLAGRKAIFALSPFTFEEFLAAKDRVLFSYVTSGEKINEIDFRKINRWYLEYIIFGGYPRAVLAQTHEEKIDALQEIYSSYIERDVVGFLEIRNKTAFKRLLKLLSAQIGQLVNVGELAMHLGVDRETIERHLYALEQTFVIQELTPYFRNLRQEIIKANKVYFLDNGLRNLVLENFDTMDSRVDKGLVLENAVFSQLSFLMRKKIGGFHFWRTKQKTEVDFVIEKGNTLLPIEVKWNVRNRSLSAGLRNFINKFSPKKVVIVSLAEKERKFHFQNAGVLTTHPVLLERNLKEMI
ncbi:MAG: ATP-binding protein, partial [Patescibacteria group bacterium]